MSYITELKESWQAETRPQRAKRVAQFLGGSALFLAGATAYFHGNESPVVDGAALIGFVVALEATPQPSGDQGSE